MTSQNKSSTTPEVKFRADYLKQSMHVISTSDKQYPQFFFPASLLFPNWYGIHGWSATVISVSLFFSQHVTFAGSGSQTTGLLPRMESSFIAHRSPEETIDANLLMTLLWRLLKHQQRGRKHLLQGELLDCSQPGLNSSAIFLGKDVDATLLSWGKYLFWGAITIMISLVAHRLICWILLIPPHKHAHIHSKAKFKKRLPWQQSEPLWRWDNNFWWYGFATTFLFSFLGAVPKGV